MAKTFSPVCLGTVIFAGMAAMVFLAAAPYAGVPCAATSTVIATPVSGSYCPRGDSFFDMDTMHVQVCVRDCDGTALPGRWVEVDPIIVESTHYFCDGEAPVICQTDVNGCCGATFSCVGGCGTKTRDGGFCCLQFSAVCEGVELGPSNLITTSSPDSDADGYVDLTDFIFFASVYITYECCADYDSDGDVDLSDFISFAQHHLHRCP